MRASSCSSSLPRQHRNKLGTSLVMEKRSWCPFTEPPWTFLWSTCSTTELSNWVKYPRNMNFGICRPRWAHFWPTLASSNRFQGICEIKEFREFKYESTSWSSKSCFKYFQMQRKIRKIPATVDQLAFCSFDLMGRLQLSETPYKSSCTLVLVTEEHGWMFPIDNSA